MTRRRRLLLLTAAGAVLFVTAASVAAVRRSPRDAYRPGEDLDGITSELSRNLPPDYPRVTFTDVTADAGISFRHFSGTRSSQIPEDMGSGAAWGDYDGDGHVDLLVVNGAGPLTLSEAERAASPARTRLYRNNGNGTFADVTGRSGITVPGLGMGAAWADYDSDGRLDVVITSYGRTMLYRNEGNGTFSDCSATSGVGWPEGFWTGASWGDYDRDGDLDLYVTGYVRYRKLETAATSFEVENPASINPSTFAPERNLLFRNDGKGAFTEVAAAAGVRDTTGRGMSAAWVDLDEDGWLDLYVANDQSDNVFFRNRGNGRFANASHAARIADYRSAMGIAVGDWNGDGAQDLFLTHWIAQENALYTNQMRNPGLPASRLGKLTFTDDADRYGLGQVSLDFVGWATSFMDYDNDGRLDLFVVNGSTLQQRSDPSQLVPMRNQLFWNRAGVEGFFDVSSVAGAHFREEHVGRGGAFADYDNDGDLDLFVVNHGGPGILLRNDGGNAKRWLQVEVRGTTANRQGIGARIHVYAAGKAQARHVGAQPSYLSQNTLVEHFGLDTTTRVDSIVVTWPGGRRDFRGATDADRRITVVQGTGGGRSASATPEPAAGAAPSRETVREFWRLIREANGHRVARRVNEAAKAYAAALALNPDHEDALYQLGNLRLELGDYAAAVQAWQRLLSVYASSQRAHLQIGSAFSCLDPGAPFRLDSAQYHFRRAHEINKEENGPLLRLGEVALLRGDFVAARRYFDMVLTTHADNATASFFRGYLSARGTVLPAPAAASGGGEAPVMSAEGDTKRGGAMLAIGERCATLRLLAQPRDSSAALAARYRELDRVISAARSRS